MTTTPSPRDPIGLLRPLYRGFLLHPLLVAAAAVFLAIAWDSSGLVRNYGVSNLFWHERGWTEFFDVEQLEVRHPPGRVAFGPSRDWRRQTDGSKRS
jgi:hypothetical protein